MEKPIWLEEEPKLPVVREWPARHQYRQAMSSAWTQLPCMPRIVSPGLCQYKKLPIPGSQAWAAVIEWKRPD